MKSDDNCERISRRIVLAGTAAALGGAAAITAVSQAIAQQKINRDVAKYQDTPNRDKRCDSCFNFQAPNACRFVEGDISPTG